MDSCSECAGYFSCSTIDSSQLMSVGKEIYLLWSFFIFILLSH
jgi:hypothetical protein